MASDASDKPSILDQPLQIEGGDVVVSLSNRPCDQLLLRSATLKHYPRFNVRLREDSKWSLDAPVVFDSAKQKDVRLFKYRLEQRKEERVAVHMLEDVEFSSDAGKEKRFGYIDDMYISDLAGGFIRLDVEPIPDYFYDSQSNYRERASIAHKIIFRILEGQAIQLDKLSISDTLKSLANAVAYAAYFDIHREVAARIRSLYESLPGIAESINSTPLFHLAMAVKLRSSAVLAAVIQRLVQTHHLCAQRYWRRTIPESTTILMLIYKWRGQLVAKAQTMLDRLHTLTCPTAPRYGGFGKFRGHFAVKFIGGKSWRSIKQRLKFLVSGIFLQWVAVEMAKTTHSEATTCEKVFRTHFCEQFPEDRDVDWLWRVHRLAYRILEAHREQNHTMLEEDIAKRTVKMFPLGALTSRSRYEQLIREELSDIIRCAAEIVREYVDVSVYKADKGEEATEQNTSEPTNTDKTITGLPANETASNEEHPVDTTNSTSPEEDAPENGGINEADNVEQIAFEWDNGSNDDDSDSSDDDAGQDQEVDMIITGNTKWENDWDFLYCGGSERLILKTEIKIGADDWPWNRGKLFPEPPAAEEVTPVSKDWAKLVGIPYIGTVEDFSTDDSMESQRRVPSAASCGRDDTRYAETGKIRRRSLPWSEMESAQVTTAHAVVALGERKHASLVATVYTNEMAAYLKLTSGRLD